MQKAITAANLAKNHYTRLRTEASSINFTSHESPFQRVSLASQCCHDTGEPLPGLMAELDPPHRFECPPDYYRVQYYEACSKVKTQLES